MNLWLVRFLNPWALGALALVPIAVWWMLRRPVALETWRRYAVVCIRVLLLLALVLALADVRRRHTVDRLAVIFLLDESDSLTAREKSAAFQAVRMLAHGMRASDLGGLIAFGAEAAVEQVLSNPLRVDDVRAVVGGNQTNIEEAIRLGLACFPAGLQKRLVLVSDGQQTTGDAEKAVREAVAAGAPIDVLPVRREARGEVMIENVHAPERARVGDTISTRIVVHSTRSGEARLRVETGSAAERSETKVVALAPGKNVFEIKRKIEAPGAFVFSCRIEPLTPEADSRTENNTGFAYTAVEGERQVLYVEGEPQGSEPLRRAMERERIAYRMVAPSEAPSNPIELRNFDAMILSNVPAHQLRRETMLLIEQAVKEYGMGLIMIGGPQSFAPGGYGATPVERVLPVDMDARNKKAFLNGALALVLHTCEFDEGNRWAAEICKESIRRLDPLDYVGVIIYDFAKGASWCVPMQRVGDREAQAAKLDSINAGDMPEFGPSMRLALAGLQGVAAGGKHMVIISDGDPSGPTPALIDQIRAARVTVSTVVINPHSDRDTDMMRRIADSCGGRFYFAKEARELPAIFAREAVTIRRSMIVEREGMQPLVRLADPVLKGIGTAGVPTIDGYVVTMAKESPLVKVPIVVVTRDTTGEEQTDPLLAHWQIGLGRAAVWTSDAKSRWAARWLAWPQYQAFWAQIIRYVARSVDERDYQFSAHVEGVRARLVVDAVDADGNFINFLGVKGRLIAPDAALSPVEFRQSGPGRYEAEAKLQGPGAYACVLTYTGPNGAAQHQVAGFVVQPGDEYRALDTNLALLANIAGQSGGRIITHIEEYNAFMAGDARSTVSGPAWRLLLLIALGLLPLDVAARRLVLPMRRLEKLVQGLGAALSRMSGRRRGETREKVQDRLLRRKKGARRLVGGEQPARPAAAPPPQEGPPAEPLIEQKPPGPGPSGSAAPSDRETMDRLLDAKKRKRRQIDKGDDRP